MRQLIFRVIGLAVIVLLSNLPTARASVGDCHITCCGYGSYNGPLPSGYTNCCQLFGNLCGGLGEAFQETSGETLVCLSWGLCGGSQD